MYLVFHSFPLVTWIYLELSHIIEDVTEYPRDCKTKQVLGPTTYKDTVGLLQRCQAQQRPKVLCQGNFYFLKGRSF